jgi:hypothetical protein
MNRPITSVTRKLFLGTILAATVAVLGGCGADKGPPLAKSGGVVNYKGAPVPGATVMFNYDNGQISTGSTDDQGKFTLTTGGREGALIGKAKVTIVKMSNPYGDMPKNPKPEDMIKMTQQQGASMSSTKAESLIPEKYSDPSRTELIADVQASGDNMNFKFDLVD